MLITPLRHCEDIIQIIQYFKKYVPEVQLSEREALLSALGIRFLYQVQV